MKGRPGVAGKVFDSLGRAEHQHQRDRAGRIRAQHLVRHRRVAAGARAERDPPGVLRNAQAARSSSLIGVGNVGSARAAAAAAAARLSARRSGFDVTVVGARRQQAVRRGRERHRPRRSGRARSDASRHQMSPRALAQAIAAMELTNAALVDCTVGPRSSTPIRRSSTRTCTSSRRTSWANALPWRRYSALMAAARARQKHFLFEANVGAGLPIVSTLRDLIASGDEIVRIEGILSGTLSYLFNTFDGTTPFSALVATRIAWGSPSRIRARISRGRTWREAADPGAPDRAEDGSRRGEGGQPRAEAAARGQVLRQVLHGVRALRRRHRCACGAAPARGTVLRYVGTLEQGARAAPG